MRWHAPGSGHFSAIVWKEWRQLLKWGAAAMCLIAVTFAQNLPRRDTLFEGMSVPESVSLAAFVLGLIQIHRDRRGDAWEFLTLRPAWRSTLFWGKVTAGVSIYLMAAGVPTFVTLAWLSVPGNLWAPFEWHLAMPFTLGLGLGLISYFAALFGGMRQKRWVLSAFLAFIAAQAIRVTVLQASDLRTFLAIAAAGMALMIVAARARFVAGGHYDAQSTASRALTGAIVALGLGILGLGLIGNPFNTTFEERERIQANIQRYVVTAEGTFVIETYNSKGDRVAITDLGHRPIEHYTPINPLFWSWRSAGRLTDSTKTFSQGWYYRATHQLPGPAHVLHERFDERGQHDHTYHERFKPKSSGRYVHSLGLIEISDYNSGRFDGWLGPNGFSPGETPPVARFEGHLASPGYSLDFLDGDELLMLSSAAYRINLRERRVALLVKAPPGETIVGVGGDAFVTTKAIYVQSPDGTTALRAPRDPRAAGYREANFMQARGNPELPTLVWYKAYDDFEPSPVRPDIVNAFNKDGALIDRYTLPPLRTPRAIPWRIEMILAAAIPVTASIALAVMQGPTSSIYLSWSPSYDDDYRHFRFASLGQRLLGWLLSAFGGLCAAALNHTIGRKYAFSSGRLRLWTAIGFLLGPLGYLLMEELLEWPARETCPSCILPRIVTRLHCEHCGAPFNPPALNGSEIFEPGTGVAAEGSR